MAGEELFISGGPLTSIAIGASGVREIEQNVRTILATAMGELFLDRHFGVYQTMVDDPTPVAVQKFRGEAMAKVEYYEPRVTVLKVGLNDPGIDESADGKLYPWVLVRVREGVLL